MASRSLPSPATPAAPAPAWPHPSPPDPPEGGERPLPEPRRAALQAFARLVTDVYHLPCSLVWDSDRPDQHRLYYQSPSRGWQCQVGTEADLAHHLHALGAAGRAAQRRQHPPRPVGRP